MKKSLPYILWLLVFPGVAMLLVRGLNHSLHHHWTWVDIYMLLSLIAAIPLLAGMIVAWARKKYSLLQKIMTIALAATELAVIILMFTAH